MLTARELLFVAGGGLSLGLAATVLDTKLPIPSDSQQHPEAMTATPMDEQAQLEAEFRAKLDELRRLENEASSPAQQWAAGALSSGQPLTMREMTVLSQIVNGQPAESSVYPDYSGSNFNSDSIAGPGAGSRSRSVLDERSASRAWLAQREPAATADHPYQGASGARYRYDLSNPSDSLRYGIDPMSQLHDSISIDPRREIDQSLGQRGAGIGQ
jgi:hypothetical protein